MNNIEQKNVEIWAWWWTKESKKYVPGKINVPEHNKDDNIKINRDKEYEKTEASTTQYQATKSQEKWEEDVLTYEQKTLKITDIFLKNNLDPKQYATVIKNLANRIWAPDEKIIMEIMRANAKIENDMQEMMKIPKKIRTGIQSFFRWPSKKETPA
jgi:hypothetical protein